LFALVVPRPEMYSRTRFISLFLLLFFNFFFIRKLAEQNPRERERVRERGALAALALNQRGDVCVQVRLVSTYYWRVCKH
jgi:hypothetical protein